MQATVSNSKIFDKKAAIKYRAHGAGCRELGESFLPGVFTTVGGIGPKELHSYLDLLFIRFRPTQDSHPLAHATARAAAIAKLTFYVHLQSILAVYQHKLLRQHTVDPSITASAECKACTERRTQGWTNRGHTCAGRGDSPRPAPQAPPPRTPTAPAGSPANTQASPP